MFIFWYILEGIYSVSLSNNQIFNSAVPLSFLTWQHLQNWGLCCFCFKKNICEGRKQTGEGLLTASIMQAITGIKSFFVDFLHNIKFTLMENNGHVGKLSHWDQNKTIQYGLLLEYNHCHQIFSYNSMHCRVLFLI